MPFAFKKDFILNARTTGFQGSGDIITLSNGNYAVGFTTTDAGDFDVAARIFKPDGTPLAFDFLLNAVISEAQIRPHLSPLANGAFVAVWQSLEAANSSSNDIKARLFSASGQQLGAEFLINSTTANNQEYPDVTTLSNGKFVVIWHSLEGSGYDIRARLYNANGTPVASDFLVNSTTSDNQLRPSVTALANGRFLAVWDSNNGTDTDIRARIFNANGAAAGDDFLVNSVTASQQTSPSVTSLAGGNVVITWSTFSATTGNFDIAARIFKPDGTPLGNEFAINNTVLGPQYTPAITALHDGRFAVAWSTPENGGDFDIRMRLFNANGSAAGNDFIVNSTTTSSQVLPHLTTLANGKIAVAWESSDPGDGDSSCVRGTIVDPLTYTGTAGVDIYNGSTGNDRIFGNGGGDSLKGGLGKDVINGGAAIDEMTGGLGADRLTGGDGSDRFVFNRLSDKGDIITDFTKASSLNSDKLIFESSAFGLGNYEGFLETSHFVSRAAGHAAVHAGDFIFDRSTDQLWFDSNGTASGGATMMVDLNNVNLAAGDIIIL